MKSAGIVTCRRGQSCNLEHVSSDCQACAYVMLCCEILEGWHMLGLKLHPQHEVYTDV